METNSVAPTADSQTRGVRGAPLRRSRRTLSLAIVRITGSGPPGVGHQRGHPQPAHLKSLALLCRLQGYTTEDARAAFYTCLDT